MINSKQKGNRGERLWRDFLRENGFKEAYRGQQYCGAKGDEDVIFPCMEAFHCEVKFVEHLNVNDAWKQAHNDKKENQIPYVAHKKKNKPWLVTVHARDFIELVHFFNAKKYMQLLDILTEPSVDDEKSPENE